MNFYWAPPTYNIWLSDIGYSVMNKKRHSPFAFYLEKTKIKQTNEYIMSHAVKGTKKENKIG